MTNGSELQVLKNEVACLLGRCMVRLQQYERLMKEIVAHHEIHGSLRELQKIAAERIEEASSKTLGTLMARFLGSYLVTEETDRAPGTVKGKQDNDAWLGLHFRMVFPAEDRVQIERSLKELVELRNNLVHHFMEQHDLWTKDGCRNACSELVDACDRIGRHFEQLREWAGRLNDMRHQAAEFVRSDAFRDWLIDGIAPDGSVIWHSSGIVRALRDASKELGIEGWTPVASAGRWIVQRYPEQRPERYRCTSWRQVLHESRLFELRYRNMNGQRAAWYRSRKQ